MALTRKFLEELGLEKETLESVIRAHGETVDALKKERDEWKGRAEEAAEGREEKLEEKKAEALKTALEAAGVAREGFRELLLRGIDFKTVELDGDTVKDAEALIASLKESYADCFSTLQVQGTPPLDPPGGRLASGDLKTLSAREINENWDQVSTLLGNGNQP